MKSLVLSLDDYTQLKRAFAGGFTHANPYYSGETQENVHSFDFTSSYPYVIVSEKFPMSSAESITIKSKEDLNKNLKLYCCLFDIEFKNLKPRVYFENYLSISHCRKVKSPQVNNGRIVSAEELTTTITEQDFFIIRKFYTWESCKIYNFKRFKKQYLPKDLILAVLELYRKKTELKDIIEFAVEYMVSKNMINAVFGMMVTDICRDEIIYNDEWSSEKPDYEDTISKYNKSIKRFLFYAWGVWVTAYARKNLFTGIYEFKDDYRYSDTDSLKCVNIEKHMGYINSYNNEARKKLKRVCDFYSIEEYLMRPKNKEGKEKELGIWDYEGLYTRFKTLGAKRYLTEKKVGDKYELTLTVSGVNKKNAVEYLLEVYGRDRIFDEFADDLKIPALYKSKKNGKVVSATGKMTHTYIDDEKKGVIVDYLGIKGRYHEYSSVHLENADYHLSISELYIDYMLGIKQISL